MCSTLPFPEGLLNACLTLRYFSHTNLLFCRATSSTLNRGVPCHFRHPASLALENLEPLGITNGLLGSRLLGFRVIQVEVSLV